MQGHGTANTWTGEPLPATRSRSIFSGSLAAALLALGACGESSLGTVDATATGADATATGPDAAEPISDAPPATADAAPIAPDAESTEVECTYFTSATGSDSNPGTFDSPFRTVAYGVELLEPGETLCIRAGLYQESLNAYSVSIPSGTSWDQPITIASYPGETATLRPPSGSTEVLRLMGQQYVVFHGLILDGVNIEAGNVVKITYSGPDPAATAHHIRLERCEVMNAPDQGILGTGDYCEFIDLDIHDNGTSDFDHGIYYSAVGTLVDGCEVYRNSGWGIHIYGGTGGLNNIVRNNLVHDNARVGDRGPGIILGTGSGHVAYNNVIWNNKGGIQIMYGGASDISVYNNTLYANGPWGFSVNAPDVRLRNNIVFQHGTPVVISGGGGLVQENNLTDEDPLFVSAETGDFRLEEGSPAIDAGRDLTAEGVTTDVEGWPRPHDAAFDIGAYEHH